MANDDEGEVWFSTGRNISDLSKSVHNYFLRLTTQIALNFFCSLITPVIYHILLPKDYL